MNRKTDAERKSKRIKFCVNKREYEKLKRATAESGLSSMSEYMLNKILATPIVEISGEDMQPILKVAENTAKAFNTIAIRLNKKGDFYPNDVEDMKNSLNTLIATLAKAEAVLDSFSVTPQTFRAVVDKAHREAKAKRL